MGSKFYYLDTDTYKVMIVGFIVACVFNIPIYTWISDAYWPWAQGFPIAWLSMCLGMMVTFFHELGHAFFGWFYGYVSLPSFDLTYGGGMTYQMTGQIIPLAVLWDLGLVWLVYALREYRGWQISAICVLLFHLGTAYNHVHETVTVFAGPLAEISIAGFLMFRAWYDVAPRGASERYLNAIFGFGMIIQAYIKGWFWLHDVYARQTYLEQKGGHGMGDFDRIADQMNWDFSTAVWIWMILAVLVTIIPAVCFIVRDSRSVLSHPSYGSN